MRISIAATATAIAAAAALPFAVDATGPQMSRTEFISAVRCVAAADVSSPEANLGDERWALNAEARRQDAETAATARAEVNAIARAAIANEAAPAMIAHHACADAPMSAERVSGRRPA